MKKPTLINLVGPTASGKTGMAVRLAEALNTEIISADSRQIYKEMRIGTAVPSEEELARVKHHFVQTISIHDNFTASDFEKEALKKINELSGRYDFIIMTGGTGLYFHAVNFGLDEIPEVPAHFRNELNRLLNEKGLEFLQAELKEKDPDYYYEVDLNNPRRVLRALEVIRYTGKPFSLFRKGTKKIRPFKSVWFGLKWPREILYERINRRVELMLEQGLVEEAKSLYPLRNLQALQTVGYKEIFDWLDNKTTFEQAVEEIKKNTRRYAKRQMTWFGKNPEITWIDMQNPEEAYRRIFNSIKTQ